MYENKTSLKQLSLNQNIILFGHGLVGWVFCGLVMFTGLTFTSELNAQIIHAIAVPLIFYFISSNYFKSYNFTKPFMTGFTFMILIIFLDFFFVALIIERSFEMFLSLLGTWVPFVLILITTTITGNRINDF